MGFLFGNRSDKSEVVKNGVVAGGINDGMNNNISEEEKDMSMDMGMEKNMEKNMNEGMDMMAMADTDTAVMTSIDKAAAVVEQKREHLREIYGENYRVDVFKPHFMETRLFLQRVRDDKHRISLLKDRIAFRKKCSLDTAYLEAELAEKEKQLALDATEVFDEISKLNDVSLEMVMAGRYVDALAWVEIAEKLDIQIRTVHRMHGKALPRMQTILLDDGLIEIIAAAHDGYADPGVEEEDSSISTQEETDEFYND